MSICWTLHEAGREVQVIAEVFDARCRLGFDDVVGTIHCGSRGLGHQIGIEFLKEMLGAACR
jgi:tRNA-splicing ligase RtcB (3'-phosphate/5'-hydroxy nucleic acid ligase)